MTGLFIVFEGCDGSGKTAMVEKAVEYVKNKTLTVVHTKDPGGTPWGSGIRGLMFGGDLKLQDLTPGGVDLLFLTSHLQNWKTCVEPALARGDVVISDRWYHSEVAYMSQRDVPSGIQAVYRTEHGGTPDLTIFLFGDPRVLLGRAKARTTETHQDRKTWSDSNVLTMVQRQYFLEFLDEPGFSPICVDDKTIDQVWEEVKDTLDGALSAHRTRQRKAAIQGKMNKYALA